jgi:hypothetical protein
VVGVEVRGKHTGDLIPSASTMSSSAFTSYAGSMSTHSPFSRSPMA